jgi:hypothetical protein
MVEFEDGQYAVTCIGANHNIVDRRVFNQVSLNPNLSGGLVVSGSGVTAQDKTDILNGVQAIVDADVVPDLTAIRLKTDDLPSGIERNVALPNFPFVMLDATTRLPKTGLTVTGSVNLDDAGFVALTNAPTETGNGAYAVDLAAGDLDGKTCLFRMTAVGAIDLFFTIVTEP